jgi:eukaryotic-like serine/threonine-protein kinase
MATLGHVRCLALGSMPMRRAACESVVRSRESAAVTRVGSLPDVGDLLADKYRIERMIGEGAMGTVFAATDEALGRRVAVKTMRHRPADSPELVARFVNEARAAARIESEHVARIFDVGRTAGGSPFLVLELLNGEDLAQTLASRWPLPVCESTGWILQALEALAEAHSLGIVHRDLKPANLFLARKRDGTSIVKLLDFGISKDERSPRLGPAITVTAAMVGSPAYMAPEQLRDARKVDARADIWALGVVLYELVTGALPFNASNVADLCVAILERSPVSVRSHRRDAPPELDDVLRRCLEREPNDRFPDVAALARALVPFGPLGSDAAAERVRTILRTPPYASTAVERSKRSRKRRVRALAVVAATVSLGAIAATCLGARASPILRSPSDSVHPVSTATPSARSP